MLLQEGGNSTIQHAASPSVCRLLFFFPINQLQASSSGLPGKSSFSHTELNRSPLVRWSSPKLLIAVVNIFRNSELQLRHATDVYVAATDVYTTWFQGWKIDEVRLRQEFGTNGPTNRPTNAGWIVGVRCSILFFGIFGSSDSYFSANLRIQYHPPQRNVKGVPEALPLGIARCLSSKKQSLSQQDLRMAFASDEKKARHGVMHR